MRRLSTPRVLLMMGFERVRRVCRRYGEVDQYRDPLAIAIAIAMPPARF